MTTDHAEKLSKLAADYRRAVKALDDARQALAKGVRDADRDEVRQGDILKATNHVWTREQVRRVVARPE